MRIIRVFPRRTKATPDDELVAVGLPRLSMYPATEFKWKIAMRFCERLRWGVMAAFMPRPPVADPTLPWPSWPSPATSGLP